MRPKKTVLLVDSNEQELSRRVFLLDVRGYKILRAKDGAQAIAMVSNALPRAIDLMVSDMLLADMDGFELVRRLKRVDPYLPCMVTSRHKEVMDVAHEANVFLGKSATSIHAAVVEQVRVLVARKRGPRKPVAPVFEKVAAGCWLDGVEHHEFPMQGAQKIEVAFEESMR